MAPKMKKSTIPLLLCLLIFIGFVFPLTVFADGHYVAQKSDGTQQTVYYRGIVPCGLGKPLCTSPFAEDGTCPGSLITTPDPSGTDSFDGVPCQFCHFFILLNGIISFLLIKLLPPLAVLMIILAGISFYFSGGNPNLLQRSKELVKAVIIGLFIAYGAYFIVGFLLFAFGALHMNPFSEFFRDGFFKVNCMVNIP